MGNRCGYNERKIEILELVTELESITAAEVAEALGLSITNAAQRLLSYHRQGDLLRVRRSGYQGRPPYSYKISDKGLDKLSYWE